jgi:pyruvate, water dikinase
MTAATTLRYVRWFESLRADDVEIVGGKNAALGELIGHFKDQGIRVPDGFAATADAYWTFLETNSLADEISSLIDDLHRDAKKLQSVGRSIRKLLLNAELPNETKEEVRDAYRELSERSGVADVHVAVRSSATAEDLPEASFAGQQESFLNISGEEKVLDACLRCYASLFTDRAISYREAQGFDHLRVALSVGVQTMVRADKGSAGVMFTLDTDSGFPRVILINAAWGLGESVVKGIVNPDQYLIYKPLLDHKHLRPIIERKIGSKQQKVVYSWSGAATRNIKTTLREQRSAVLTSDEILQLARWGAAIENHYGQPMDIEWAKDGQTGEMFILQARPETVHARKQGAPLKSYRLKEQGRALLSGLAIGSGIAAGKVCLVKSARQIERFSEGAILVTTMTDPDWVPIMKRAAGIVTDTGGRTCHAAIVSRELGIPAVVGTGGATTKVHQGQAVTISCAEGSEGKVYEGELEFQTEELKPEDLPKTRTKILLNVASPESALRYWRLPADGVGLARIEFIITNAIQIHPLALVRFDELKDATSRRKIRDLTQNYGDKAEYFVEHLALGIAKIAAAWHPRPVIVRLSDFKTNEYADLIGGRQFEPHEANPMLGFRGAARYVSDQYRDGFALECRAISRVREEIGLDNVIVMVPFCRTPREADGVLQVMSEQGLNRGQKGLKTYVMCEIPSNVLLAEQFARRFDGFSIGSNDLTQLVLGVDRDSELLASSFDERNEAVKRMIQDVIAAAHKSDRPISICGEAPSNYPEFATFLVEQKIDSISVNPDSFITVKRQVAKAEHEKR